ncbi:MAG: prepilin-type N-terminal cleavage/methylation domain-containing protein [Elusimicrobiaceae bacterium]|nr:prepilin-type N-terminal cleavage/methylation domain-containing protein [Elusimicrobiaceae bacterium]
MKKNSNSFLISGRRGFTLTEVLLAVMIVGLIGVALASLTRSAAREGGVGRSKILLRNNLASFVRTLRKDLASATVVNATGIITASNSTPIKLLEIGQNVQADGVTPVAMDPNAPGAKKITYCFVRGNNNTNIVPSSAYRGGAIYRVKGDTYSCPDSAMTSSNLVLNNVKYIPQGTTTPNYPVPLFVRDNFSRADSPNLLTVRLITELDSTPIINDVINETFSAPMGY